MPVLVGLAAALMALALVIAQTTVAQQEARDRAMNESEMLLALSALMSATLDAETSQRGYLLTGETAYLAPYSDARQRRDTALARLRTLSAESGDATSTQRLARIEAVTAAKFDEIGRSLALARAGFTGQALALVRANFGKMQMDVLRREVAQLGSAITERRRDAFERAATLERRLPPLVGVLGLAIVALAYAGFRAERRRATVEAEAEQAGALREANERAELLARELNHRVKNLFSVILAIVALSGRNAGDAARAVLDDVRARIRALALAHAASQGGGATGAVGLGPLITRTLEPYSDGQGRRVRVEGPEVRLPAHSVTPVGLVVHELATNAVKYGALSVPEGRVEIGWRLEPAGEGEDDRPLLVLSWIEQGGPSPAHGAADAPVGFGTQMATLAAGQLGGTFEREWPENGAVARLSFPLP